MEDDGKLRNLGIDDKDITFIEEQISGNSSYLQGVNIEHISGDKCHN